MNSSERLAFPAVGLIGTSPVFEVACLTARARFGTEEADRVKAIVGAAAFDWSEFFSLIGRHYVIPLVHRNLAAMGGDVIPPKVLETLRVRARLNAWKAQRFATELVRLYSVFEAHSIETIHYKGAVAAEQYYGAVALRTFGDLDFLVRRRDVEKMVRLLEAEGYLNSGEFTPELFEHYVAEFKEFLFIRGDFALEPHWSLAGRRYPFDVPYEGFWQRARLLRFNGAEVRVLGAEDALLVLCLVGAKGRWKRLQMVCDVAECMRTFPEADWRAVVRIAKETGTYRIMLLGLWLAEALAGASAPGIVRTDLRSSPVERLARDVVRALIAPPMERRFLPSGPSVFSPLLFRQRERLGDRWRYLWRTTTTPSPLHMERMPLPRWLMSFYSVLVPLHDYVLIPAGRFFRREDAEDAAETPEPTPAAAPVVAEGAAPDRRPKQTAAALVQRVGDELVVMHRKTRAQHNLNVTAAWIFDQCDGKTKVGEITDRFVEKFSVDRIVAERDVLATLRHLQACGLLSQET